MTPGRRSSRWSIAQSGSGRAVALWGGGGGNSRRSKAASSSSSGSGQASAARRARTMYSPAEVGPMPTARAIRRLDRPRAKWRRTTSRIFRMDNLSAGIAVLSPRGQKVARLTRGRMVSSLLAGIPSSSWLSRTAMPRLLTRGERRRRNRLQSGRLHLATLAGITSERWPTSDRNRWPACVGICTRGRVRELEAAVSDQLEMTSQRLPMTPRRRGR